MKLTRALWPAVFFAFTVGISIPSEIYFGNEKEFLVGYGAVLPLTLIAAAAKVKAGIVSRDEQERGERRCLNLGHTFAHAIEHEARQAGLDITHGEAVAVGILLAARLSEAMGLAPKGLAARLEADWTACGLPTGVPFDLGTLTAAMTKDKKAEGDTIHFVLLSSIGQVEIRKISAAEATAQLL